MKKPSVLEPGDPATKVGEIFSTPLMVKGITWFPLVQLVTWSIISWIAKKRVPGRSWQQSISTGALTTLVALGSEWGHNLAHAAAAKMVGKPMDAIRITWGMPLLVYYDINDQDVTPRQHILRALGGPVFNLLLLPVAILFKKITKPNSAARDVANTAAAANTFLPSVGLLPIPGLDGGPILKWSLVENGATPSEADLAVRKTNGVLSLLMGISGGLLFKKKQWLAGSGLITFSAIALAIATGKLKEQD